MNNNGLTIPNHIAIIPDGNRRWARAHHMPEWMGHRYGGKTAENLIDWAIELEIPQVSLWAGSSENLSNRSPKEVEELFNVYYRFLKRWEKKKPIFDKYQIKVRFIGDLDKLPPKLVKLMGKIMQKTAKYQKAVLNILIHYGGKFELTETMKKIAEKMIKIGKIEVSERDIENNLMLSVPVDLTIRTGGEKRLSNFLLWQTAYSELIFIPKLWPDFTKKDLIWCIKEYNRRQRRFGK